MLHHRLGAFCHTHLELTIPVPMGLLSSCPSTGCTTKERAEHMEDHLRVCPWKEVECPCVGCYQRMLRYEVSVHIEKNALAHMQQAIFETKVNASILDDLSIQHGDISTKNITLLKKVDTLEKFISTRMPIVGGSTSMTRACSSHSI